MYLRKSILAVIIIISLIVGIAGGFGGAYYKYVYAPKKEAERIAKEQQERLNEMVRYGEVVSVEPERITVKVKDGGGDIGETITVKANERTSVQVGIGLVNEPGVKVDLTQWFKTGDYVDMLVEDGQVLAIHRELRPEEQQKEEITENIPEQQITENIPEQQITENILE